MAEELRQQVPVIKDVLKAMDIEIIEKEGLRRTTFWGRSRTCARRRGWTSPSSPVTGIPFSLPRNM